MIADTSLLVRGAMPIPKAKETPTRKGNGRRAIPEPQAEPLQASFRLDDTGNAERFVHQHGDNVRYVHTWGKWFMWNGQYWCEDETRQVDLLAKATARSIYAEATAAATAGNDDLADKLAKWARASGSAAKRAAMLSLAQSEKPIAITHRALNADPYLVACKNGTVDLRTCQLRAADRADLITKCLPVEYDPAATCPLWLSVLQRIMPNEASRGFMQRGAGVSLSGLTVKTLFFLHGDGDNGKSTFVELLLALFGDYATKTDAETLLTQDRRSIPNDVAALVGKRLVIASELPDGRRLNESRVKDLTGGDTISARFLNKEFFTFK